jgi:hypothetical protein
MPDGVVIGMVRMLPKHRYTHALGGYLGTRLAIQQPEGVHTNPERVRILRHHLHECTGNKSNHAKDS